MPMDEPQVGTTSESLFRSRLFFLGMIAAIVAMVLVLNRDALFTHPSQVVRPLIDAEPPPETTPALDVTFAVYDTETTGVDPFIHRMLELAVVKFKNGVVLGERSWLMNPERFIPEETQAVHGIDAAMIEDQRLFREMYPEFAEFVAGCVLVAHNAPFDVRFVQQEAKRAGLPPLNLPVIDSLRLFRAWFPDQEGYSLEVLTEAMGVKDAGSFHRAKADSVYLGRILFKGLSEQSPSPTLGDLYRESGGPLHL